MSKPALVSSVGERSTMLRYLAIGALAGLMAGFFGVGGGFVVVPLLIAVSGFDRHGAHATSLAALILFAAGSFSGYLLADEVDLQAGVLLGIGGVVGSVAGATLMHRMPERVLQAAFAVIMLAAGARMLS